VAALRAAGRRVVLALPGQDGRPAGCRRRLALRDGEWTVDDMDGEGERT